ncbi:hypothetical protein VNO78_33375 [Psophocarpus tetragonolobus]|uniref:Uncharacterized protein n=1 Tax=Psophocarpus tetragonolobus TaxID=3891 RepID=A0AAN9RPM9_PSOTE
MHRELGQGLRPCTASWDKTFAMDRELGQGLRPCTASWDKTFAMDRELGQGLRPCTASWDKTFAMDRELGQGLRPCTASWDKTFAMDRELGQGLRPCTASWDKTFAMDRELGQGLRPCTATRPLCHLQYPVAYLSRLQRILPAARWELRFKASHRANPPCEGRQRHVPLGGRGPLLLVGKRTTGARVASSPDSDLEAFSHNPTHGSFAPLAFQPSAMTNCANQRFLSY